MILIMRWILTSMFSIVLTLTISGQNEKKIVILNTNDIHSRLYGAPPESSYTPLTINDDNTTGGFSRIATILKKEKEANDGITLTVDAGDFLMGTLFQSLEAETGFQLQLMKKMGYDVVCLGNHEFDFGPEKLASIISSSAKGGPVPEIIYGNMTFDSQDPADDGLTKLDSDGTISKKFIFEKDGFKIGAFSLLGKDAADVSPKAKPVSFSRQFSYAKRMVKELESDNCDMIICISHSGVAMEKNGAWGGEDADLARKVKGIDLIISGHTHTKLDKPMFINGVPIVQAGENGQNVGRLELKWTNGKLIVEGYRLICVNDSIMGDQEIEQLISEQRNRISDELLKPYGLRYSDPVAESSFLLECDVQGDYKSSNLGPLVADAIQSYVNKNNNAGCDISFVSAGVIREKIVPGIATAPDIFRIMSLGSGNDNIPGYPLARLYVTGKELKSILEILQIAYKSSTDYYCYYSGFRSEYDPEKGLLRRIKKIEIIRPDGTTKEVDFSRDNKTLYSVTANSYMLEFIGIIKKMSFGLINVIPKDASGKPVTDMSTALIDINENLPGVQEGKEWLALMEYIRSMKDTNNNGIPDIDPRYKVPVRSFFEVKH